MKAIHYWIIIILALAVLLIRAKMTGGQPIPDVTKTKPAFTTEQKAAISTLYDHGGILIHLDERRPGQPVILVDFTNHPEFHNEWLKQLVPFTELSTVGLGGTALTDEGLDYVIKLPKLETLSLNDTPITDQGLAKLAACKHLRTLDVHGTKVSATGVATLQKALPDLKITLEAPAQTAAGNTPTVSGATPATGAQEKRFTAAEVAKWRERIGELGKLPENTPDGWSKSKVDPAKLLTVFPKLKVRPGYVLRAYQFKDDGNANGFVYALPAEAAYPEPEDCPKLESHFLTPPKPFDALDDLMEAIEGNDSAESYLHASMLRRELKEFGCSWHGIDWGTHVVLDDHPWKNAKSPEAEGFDPMSSPQNPPEKWEWKHPRPTDWAPRVVLGGDNATVTYYTFTGFDKEKVVLHTEVYRRGKYRPRIEETVIGQSDIGYRF